MDPLSMTASIIAILQLTTTLTSYINDVRHATKEQAKVVVEATNLYGLLTSLRFRIEEARSDDSWFNQVRLLGTRDGPLDQFKDTLERMVRQISSSRKRDQVKSALTWKFTKSEVEDALKRIERLKSLVNCALTEDVFTLSQAIHSDVVTLGNQMERLDVCTERLQTHANQELQHRLQQWLEIPDPSTNYHAALQKWHPETGLWLVDGTRFDNWKSSESSLMWLHGNAGCGKTVLSAVALQSLLQQQESRSDTAVSYFYFDFNDVEKQSSRTAIRSLLFQFAQQAANGLQDLEQLYQKCRSGEQQPAEDAIQSLLRNTIDKIDFKYVVLDALDECTDREVLLTFIYDLLNGKLEGLLVMATSRRERDIEEQLRPIADYNINIQSAVVDKDIKVYVQNRLATDFKLKKWPESVRNEITSVIIEKAHGMFRWVECQLESIRQCVKLRALREVLSSLPKTLDETYDRILRDLESRGQLRDAITTLQWLCHSNRPLKLSEMVDVLATENGDNGGFFPEERLPNPADIMVVCSSLISYDAVDDDNGDWSDDDLNYDDSDDDTSRDDGIEECPTTEIRLAHFSVKEYLLSNRCILRSDFQTPICHAVIAEGCLHYLLHLCKKAPLTKKALDQHPLVRYAAEFWWQHARKIDSTRGRTVFDLATRLLTNKNDAWLSWVQLYNIDEWWKGSNLSLTINDVAQPLYYAASIGVPEVVENILQTAADVNARGGYYGTALQAASVCGQATVVQMLLAAGADVNDRGGRYGTALQAASLNGQATVVQMLLAAGADVTVADDNGWTPLNAAAKGGHIEVVKFLLENGADVTVADDNGWTPLNTAADSGHFEVVKLLIEQGAEVNTRILEQWTPLHLAAKNGDIEVVKLLIEQGAEVNARNQNGQTPLHLVAQSDYIGVLNLLITLATTKGDTLCSKEGFTESRVDANIQDAFGCTALHLAVYNKRSEAALALAEHGVDFSLVDGYGRSALEWDSICQGPFRNTERLRTYILTPDCVRVDSLRRSVFLLSAGLLQTKQRRLYPGFYQLAHCLMFLDEYDNARFSFQQQVVRVQEDGSPVHDICCDGCDKSPIIGSRFVCKTCPNVDLCDACMQQYLLEDRPQVCLNHGFLEVSEPLSRSSEAESTDTVHESVVAWLRHIVSRYGELQQYGSQ